MSGGSLLVMLISFVTCFPQASGKNFRIGVLKSNTGLILLWLHKCSVCCYPLVSNANLIDLVGNTMDNGTVSSKSGIIELSGNVKMDSQQDV